MKGAGDAKVVEVDAVAPAAGEQAAVEEVGVAEVAQAFGHAHVQPDAGARVGMGLVKQGEDAAIVPPDAGRDDGEFAEGFRMREAEGERDETSERGTAEGRVGWGGEGSEAGVDVREQGFEQELAIEGALASTEFGVGGGGVLGHAAEAGVGDADEDEGLDEAGGGELVCGGVGAPGVAGEVGGSWVEEVLAVVEIEDGEAPAGLGAVGFR